MIFISENQHGTFLKYLDESIQKIENNDAVSANASVSIPELKEDIDRLTAFYFEYHHSIEQLRLLVTQYKQLQTKTRVKLRVMQLEYLRKLNISHRETPFTKTHKSIL